MQVRFGVLGPVSAWNDAGAAIPLKGPRHRAVLARLIVARGRIVPLATLIDDLWSDPPADAPGVIQTFVSALRRVLEPDRLPRAPGRLLVTEGSGYALRATPDSVDARRFEEAVGTARALPPSGAVQVLDDAFSWWRGPAYADLPDDLWARTERSRLAELRLGAVELRARALLDVGNVDAVVPDLDAHTAEHPWREEGWRLLAIALYRSGRQKDALEVVRRARSRLGEDLGLTPGPRLRHLETDILQQATHLDAPPVVGTAAGQVWSETIAAYSRPVTVDSRARLRSTVDLLRSLAVTGGSGLVAARHQRMASILAAEELGDADLTARVIGAYDVPAIWSRSDDPEQAAAVVAAAERALAALPVDAPGPELTRLLATIALESRGVTDPRGRLAAEQAVTRARRSGDPALLAFALNGLFMQTFHRAGLATQRDAIGAELIEISTRHGLETYELLGRLIRMQALSGLGDLAGADVHALAADRLAQRYGSPLIAVFTTWYRALRVAADADDLASAAEAYRGAARALDDAGMPGLERGLLPLALLTVRIRLRLPAPADDHIDWGPYTPWVRPLALIAHGDLDDATTALRTLPDPPRDHLQEALWCVVARAAVALDDRGTMQRALDALAPAGAELAGAGSGLMTLGPVAAFLDELTQALDR